ncbi:hypothetical protein [Prauserella rugosa]|uniref:Uncharacterized protein n=1 Tax=Prauserella rugosa TaxID=43354 RepID=A0A660C8N4_9PSEU|nr:hypothetical protein [Prauserella rugosa]TWH19908.1 hypothetical protein JD82_01746 [Prauserella rugosa]
MHGEVDAGDGVIWMHREAPEHGLVSPATHDRGGGLWSFMEPLPG